MKVKCITDVIYFTVGEVYDVDYIDDDGDFWCYCNDGDLAFLRPGECEVIDDNA